MSQPASTRSDGVSRVAVDRHFSSVLVAALSSAFGVFLMAVTGVLSEVIAASGLESELVTFVLSFIALVFVAIALYVGALVTANTFATVIASRTRTIALMRLLGASAAHQRRSVVREGLVVGLIGATLGAIAGFAATAILLAVAVSTDVIPAGEYTFLVPANLIPVLAVVATTVAASWVGSRRVLDVSPIAATGSAIETAEDAGASTGRRVTATVTFAIGGVILALGIFIGLSSPIGVLVGVVGGILSFTGVVIGAQIVMPRTLRFVGRMFGGGVASRLARENAVRYPQRSTRVTIGLVIAITLITTFSVTVGTFKTIVRTAQESQPDVYAGVGPILDTTIVVFSILMGFSAIIAAVGLVNNLSLNVLQRTRELGLLRALGFTARQVRQLIVLESLQLAGAAAVVGLILGTVYGWAGAQSLLGSIPGSPGVVLPTVPLDLVGSIVASAVILGLVASIAPARRAVRSTPIAALADR